MDLVKSFSSRAQFAAFNDDDLPSTLSDTIGAAFALAHREERISSATNAWRDKNDARGDTIAKLGGNKSLVTDYGNMLPEHRAMFRDAERAGTLEQNPFWRGMGARRQLAYEHVRDFEKRFPDQVADDQKILEEFKAEAAELRAGEQFTIQRGSGFGAFLGTAGAIMTDPLILLSLGVGAEFGVGRSVLATIGRAAAIEGSVAALVEIPIQTEVLRFKRELDSPWSFRQSALNVLAAGGGGVVLGGTIGGGVVGARKGLARYRAAKEAGEITPTQVMDEAEQVLEDTLALHDENRLGTEEFPADNMHERAFEEARVQHTDGEPVDVRQTVEFSEPDDGINRVLDRAVDPSELVPLGPDDLVIDAKRFQFKSGADGAGVTDALRGVTKFDRMQAGVSIIWEDAAGTRFVVDGHQRHALAKRAIAGGQDPAEVKLNAFILREADGVTDIDARRMAAVKNMSEGTGSALDAAKILRDVGPMGESILPPMPPNSALVRQARGLAKLGEDEFLQVVNGVIPERFGALVGAATAEPKLQQAMIGVLRRTKPANETQARAIVDQVRTVGTETRITEDLFGAQQVTESLYLERAQVLDAALRESRKDKAVFGRLLAEEERITEAGENVLDRAANFERLQEAKDAQAKISRLANTKGPISEALTEAARQVKGGKKPAQVTEAFLESVRRTLLEGDSRGRQAGRARPGGDQAGAEGELGPRQADADQFDFERDTRLGPEEQAIEQRMIDDFETTPWAELTARYDALEDAGGGQILSVDTARELSPDYLADRTLSNAVHEPSSAFIKRLYAQRLTEAPGPGKDPLVMFTAGGTGAGKSAGLKLDGSIGRAQIIMDGNLAKFASGTQKIDQALAAGKEVVINYVHRDPLESFVNGAIKRAMKQVEEFGSGRTIPLETHVSTHVGANQTIRQIAKKYADEPRLAIEAVNNNNGRGNAELFDSVDDVPIIIERKLAAEVGAALEEALENGTITQEIFEGFKGTRAADGAGARGRDQRAGAGRAGAEGKTEAQLELVVDAAPRSIVRALDDSPSPSPDATRTGTVPDTEYDAVLAQAETIIDDQGALATVSREVNGELETRTLRAELEGLDALEDTIERIRICSATRKAA